LPRLYVGNLAHSTTEADLRAAFSPFGEVTSATVATDRRGHSKLFGYVEMPDEAEAAKAIDSLRGSRINGNVADVVIDEPQRRQSARRYRR
jgi:RNA recognition motif-containing protein